MKEKITTKFGIATLNEHTGYYAITSAKEGNHGKSLHRLIYEDYFHISLLDTAIIHHIDGNKLNNDISNLKLVSASEHINLHKSGENHHWFGKSLPQSVRDKISNSHKGKKLSKVTREKLVKNQQDKWFKESKDIIIHNKHSLNHRVNLSKSQNTSGYYRVSKQRKKCYAQGFTWAYSYYGDDGKQRHITSVNIDNLKEKVLSKGLEWIELPKGENIAN